ncbi:uncharacterized protein LOC123008598 [Tribolium madens]|uniref:uncharacterized protein LOC123008598 n=1 Tax=Tribolium madens TaxID=41895 RepID=UPI001CF7226E|nr:uncharacterized protein LOC123008598 [Tribolium madens]
MFFFTTQSIFLALLPTFALTLTCYSCQNGYETETQCSNQLPAGIWETCDQPNSQCVQSIEWFQHGALRLAVRKCWAPSGNNTKNYCQNYKNKVGKLKFCEVCTRDLCNNKNLYKPLKNTCRPNHHHHKHF